MQTDKTRIMGNSPHHSEFIQKEHEFKEFVGFDAQYRISKNSF